MCSALDDTKTNAREANNAPEVPVGTDRNTAHRRKPYCRDDEQTERGREQRRGQQDQLTADCIAKSHGDGAFAEVGATNVDVDKGSFASRGCALRGVQLRRKVAFRRQDVVANATVALRNCKQQHTEAHSKPTPYRRGLGCGDALVLYGVYSSWHATLSPNLGACSRSICVHPASLPTNAMMGTCQPRTTRYQRHGSNMPITMSRCKNHKTRKGAALHSTTLRSQQRQTQQRRVRVATMEGTHVVALERVVLRDGVPDGAVTPQQPHLVVRTHKLRSQRETAAHAQRAERAGV